MGRARAPIENPEGSGARFSYARSVRFRRGVNSVEHLPSGAPSGTD